MVKVFFKTKPPLSKKHIYPKITTPFYEAVVIFLLFPKKIFGN